MRNRSHVLLAVAALSAGVLPAAGVSATAPMHVLPVQHDIWLSGTLHRNDGKRTGGRFHEHPSGPPSHLALQRYRRDRHPGRRRHSERPGVSLAVRESAGRREGTRHLSSFRHSVRARTRLRVPYLLTAARRSRAEPEQVGRRHTRARAPGSLIGASMIAPPDGVSLETAVRGPRWVQSLMSVNRCGE
jgi:hypothetical protein